MNLKVIDVHLAIFVILLAVGTGIGYILASIGRRVGAKI